MQICSLARCFGAIGVSFFSLAAHAQGHAHLDVGAEDQNPGSKLIFANGASFATNSSYVKTLNFATNGTYAGYYAGNTTFTALPTTAAFGGPDAQASAPGSYIIVELVSLDGPAGGEFSFWETGATSPTITITAGETGTNTWILSESDGSPGSDPYGHIHGRQLTLNKPGLYTVGFRAHDISVNGPGGGPIHQPSEIFYTYFEAGVNLLSVTVDPGLDHATIKFVAPLGNTWQLESAFMLDPVVTVWIPLGDPVTGDDAIHEVTDFHEVEDNRFYRLRSVP